MPQRAQSSHSDDGLGRTFRIVVSQIGLMGAFALQALSIGGSDGLDYLFTLAAIYVGASSLLVLVSSLFLRDESLANMICLVPFVPLGPLAIGVALFAVFAGMYLLTSGRENEWNLRRTVALSAWT